MTTTTFTSAAAGIAHLDYYAGGALQAVQLVPYAGAAGPSASGRRGPARGGDPQAARRLRAAASATPFLKERMPEDGEVAMMAVRPRGRGAAVARATTMLATRTVIVEGARRADLQAAIDRGARVLHEGLDGKALLQCATVDQAFGIAKLLTERNVGSATPNFMRYRSKPAPSQAGAALWNHDMIGVAEAWKLTKGKAAVRVAVLDEGVDTSHAALRAAVVAEKDFIGGNGASAMPDGDDAHGTECAGIIVGRTKRAPGIASRCSLIAARIAKGDDQGNWIFDDYATADAIDWCWREGAWVLSNSWGGGMPSDAITRAMGRARTQGRGGLGCVVCNAAGNDQALIDYPASLSGYVTVGASNQFDERKTRASQDGEDWWGSSFGPTMWLLAPGVQIQTTDITGGHGDSSGDYTGSFNGTSAATPHVAAVAALMLSANPALSASDVRQMLKASAHKLAGQSGFTIQLGWGRLDAARAVRMAAGKEDAPTKPKPKPKPKKKPKKKKKAKKAGGRK